MIPVMHYGNESVFFYLFRASVQNRSVLCWVSTGQSDMLNSSSIWTNTNGRCGNTINFVHFPNGERILAPKINTNNHCYTWRMSVRRWRIVIKPCDPTSRNHNLFRNWRSEKLFSHTRVGTLIVATIYLQLIQNTRYMLLSFNVVTSIVYNPLPAMWKS